MKIIKNGNISTYRNTCPHCGCEYEYDDTDIQYGYTSLTTTGYSAYVTCPCCGQINYINQYKPQPNYPYPWFNPTIMYCDCKHQNQEDFRTNE